MKSVFTWLLIMGVVTLTYSFISLPHTAEESMEMLKSERAVAAVPARYDLMGLLPYLGGLSTLIGLVERVYKFVAWVWRGKQGKGKRGKV